MARFLTELDTRELGKDLHILLSSLLYESEIVGPVKVPKGFITDFISVKKCLGILYWLFHDSSNKSAVVHDYLYSVGTPVSRLDADRTFEEACLADGVAGWKAALMYRGLRLFGGSHYRGSK